MLYWGKVNNDNVISLDGFLAVQQCFPFGFFGGDHQRIDGGGLGVLYTSKTSFREEV